MSKSNWKGGSGWTAVSDPTSVLSGKTLVATAGLSQVAEDYLLQLPDTTTAFIEDHYSVIMNYAWPQSGGLHPMSMGSLGLIARSGTFSGSKALNAYIGKLDAEAGTISICRRNSDTETVLVQCDLPSDVLSRGVRHAMEFKCVGTNPTTLQLAIDNTVFCTFGDVSSSILSTGYPGIYVRSGTAYVDNFCAVKYTSSGGNATEWIPSNSSTSIAAWYKSDSGLTTDIRDGTPFISGWTDSSTNTNNLSQLTSANQPLYSANFILTLPVVSFDSTDSLIAADSASLDITGETTIFIVVYVPVLETPSARTILSKGASPNYAVKLDSTNAPQFTGGASTSTATSSISTNSFQLVEVVSNSNFYINGTSAGSVVTTGATNSDSISLSFGSDGKIAEVIIYDGSLSTDDRQKVEGYLSHKWQLSDLLPSGHPYKKFSPLV